MGRHFSKKKGGMPAFGNRGDAGRGQRVPRFLPQSPQDMSLDPPRDVIFNIGTDETRQPPQRPSPSLNPSVSEFVMPYTSPLSAPAPATTTTTYQLGAPVVLNPRAPDYVLPPPSIRGNVYYPLRTSPLYPNMEFSNSATNIPGLPEKDPSRRWWKNLNRGGGKQIKKKSSRRQTRQKKQQRRQSRKTRRNMK